jgi:hypothetical protein
MTPATTTTNQNGSNVFSGHSTTPNSSNTPSHFIFNNFVEPSDNFNQLGQTSNNSNINNSSVNSKNNNNSRSNPYLNLQCKY